MTTGHVIVMGRRTFESIGRLLPDRMTIVLSCSGFSHSETVTICSLAELPRRVIDRTVFICGGAEVYAQALPLCADLYPTLVKRNVEGDAYFPRFEDQFVLAKKSRTSEASRFLTTASARFPIESNCVGTTSHAHARNVARSGVPSRKWQEDDPSTSPNRPKSEPRAQAR